MTEIVLAKHSDVPLSEPQREVLRTFLFGIIDGLSDKDKKAWRRFWSWFNKAGSGEILSIETWTPRVGVFHRKHMAMESKIFQNQERIASFEQFRSWLKIGSGFVDWMAGPKGGVVPVPRSISYKKCDEETMRQFHDDMVTFLRTEHAQKYLWPHLTPFMAETMIESILTEFKE